MSRGRDDGCMSVRVWLCGDLCVEADGADIGGRLPARQGRLLFAYLVLSRRRAARRDELIDAIWPRSAPRDPAGALASVLARLRGVLGADRLPTRGAVRLELGADAWVDVETAHAAPAEARRALDGDSPERALELAAGALATVEQPLLAEFERDWIDDRRRELLGLMVPLVVVAVDAGVLVGGSGLAQAELLARRGVEREPLSESVHAALMRAVAARGDSAEALRVYERIRVRLREELGASPSRALLDLHRRLLTDQPAPQPTHRDPRPVRIPLPQTATPWPVVARDKELRRVMAAVRDPAVRGLVVTGDAGVGKTWLLRSAIDELARDDLVAAYWVQGSEAAAALPYGAVAHLLPDTAAEPSHLELLHRARASLSSSGSRGVVVAVDDAHLLDAASATLVGFLVASGTGTVLLTMRSDVAGPDVIASMVATGQLERLELDKLSLDAVTDLLARVLGGRLDPAAAQTFWRRSDGNPLLLRELLASSLRHETLCERSGFWRLTGVPVGRRLGELIGARVAELDAPAATAACLLALGEPLEAALFETLAGHAGAATIERAGLLGAVPDVDGRRHLIGFVHPLYGEALQATVTPLQRRALLARLADGLEATGARRRGDVVRLATWWLGCGRSGEPDVFVTAARRALMAFDHSLAERLARAAVQGGGGFSAKIVLAFALRWQGRSVEANAVVAGWRTEAGSDIERADAVISIAETIDAQTGEAGAGYALLTDAAKLVHDPVARRRLVGARAERELFGEMRVRDALATLEALSLDDGAVPDDPLELAVVTMAAAALAGRLDSAQATAGAVLDTLAGREGVWNRIVEETVLQWSAYAQLLAGRVADARRLSAVRYRLAVEQQIPELQAIWALARGFVALLAGEAGTACTCLREAAELARAHLQRMGGFPLTASLGALAEAAALLGNLAETDTALAQAHGEHALPGAVPAGPRQLGEVWQSAARGEVTAARGLAVRCADTQRAVGAHAFEALALHAAVRLGAAGAELLRAVERLEALTEVVDGELIRVLAAHGRARHDHDVPALLEASTRLERLGLMLHAADAAAQAAQLYRDSGRGSPAHAAAARARRLADRCQGARTPELECSESQCR